MSYVVPLVDGELGGVLGPGVVGEQALDLVVRRDAARDVPEVGQETKLDPLPTGHLK